MPIYPQHCETCGEFEVIKKITDDSPTLCPKCGKLSKRLMGGGAGFVLKGKGFYSPGKNFPKAK